MRTGSPHSGYVLPLDETLEYMTSFNVDHRVLPVSRDDPEQRTHFLSHGYVSASALKSDAFIGWRIYEEDGYDGNYVRRGEQR